MISLRDITPRVLMSVQTSPWFRQYISKLQKWLLSIMSEGNLVI